MNKKDYFTGSEPYISEQVDVSVIHCSAFHMHHDGCSRIFIKLYKLCSVVNTESKQYGLAVTSLNMNRVND